jgi:branched-chain amino acid transport system permease protein
MDCQLDIFFLEAVLNGILLAGLLALLALGLNLIFGVIDVVWICYAELVMVGMYGIHYAYKGGTPFLVAALAELVGTYGEDAVAKFVEGFPARIRNGEFSVGLAKQ